MAIVDFGTQTNASQEKLESPRNKAESHRDTKAQLFCTPDKPANQTRKVAEDSPFGKEQISDFQDRNTVMCIWRTKPGL